MPVTLTNARSNSLSAWGNFGLARKLRAAAEIETAAVLPHPPMYFRKGGRVGKLVTVTFEGVLRVVDSMVLTSCLENGIGPAKAFGCGLLLVRRI